MRSKLDLDERIFGVKNFSLGDLNNGITINKIQDEIGQRVCV